MTTALFILGTVAPFVVTLIAWWILRNKRIWWRLLAVFVSLLLSFPFGVALVMESIVWGDPERRAPPGAGFAALPVAYVWFLVFIGVIVVELAHASWLRRKGRPEQA